MSLKVNDEKRKKLLKNVTDSSFLSILFVIMSFGVFYPYIHSKIALIIASTVVLFTLGWTMKLRFVKKISEHQVLLFQSFSAIVVSFSSTTLSFTLFYIYLKVESLGFLVIYSLAYFLFGILHVVREKNKIIEKFSVSTKNQKAVRTIGATSGIFGLLVARVLIRNMNQNEILIVLIFIFSLIAFTTEFVGIVFSIAERGKINNWVLYCGY